MALSGSFTTTGGYDGREYKFSWTATQSVANNTSTISWKLEAVGGNSGYYIERTVNVVVAGETVYSKTAEVQRYVGTVASGTKTITHNTDGTKSFSASVECASYYGAINCRGSASFVLDTIARATTPTLSASSIAMNSALTISTPRASSSFTHTLRYAFGSASGTIATGVATSQSWTVPLSLANQIPNATSGAGTIYCDTYNGSTLIGTKSVTFTATVPSSVVPSISSVALSDPTGYATTYGGYVQHKSKLKVQVTSAGSYSSTISKVSITANGVTVATNPYTTNTLTASAGSKSVSVTVTDSRGRTATKTASYTIIGYSSPTISTLSVYRCDSAGNKDDEGAYMNITYAGSITSLNSKNTKSFSVQYKLQSATSWTTATSSTSAYSVSSSVIVSASTESTYDVRMVATDAFSTTTKTAGIGTAFTLMDFNASGKAMAIGKVSEVDNTLEVGLPISASSKVTATGEIISKSTNAFRAVGGNYGFFIRNDGSATYFLLTVSGDQYGSYNDLRPLTINDSTGAVIISNGLTTATIQNNGMITSNYVRLHGGLHLGSGQPYIYTSDGNNINFRYTNSAGSTAYTSIQALSVITALKFIKCGTTVISNMTSGATSVTLMTLATVQGWYSGANALNTAIFVTNGDGSANSKHVDGTTYMNSQWYATFDSGTTATAIRINWMLVVW